MYSYFVYYSLIVQPLKNIKTRDTRVLQYGHILHMKFEKNCQLNALFHRHFTDPIH